MTNLESVTLSTKKHCDFYEQKIAAHTPPKGVSDEKIIRQYQRLLIRDRSFLYDLELINLKESMHANIAQTSANPYSSQSHSSLDLDEFRALLDESSHFIQKQNSHLEERR
jgi:hypothetical protein